jgi:hypothetical protein
VPTTKQKKRVKYKAAYEPITTKHKQNDKHKRKKRRRRPTHLNLSILIVGINATEARWQLRHEERDAASRRDLGQVRVLYLHEAEGRNHKLVTTPRGSNAIAHARGRLARGRSFCPVVVARPHGARMHHNDGALRDAGARNSSSRASFARTGRPNTPGPRWQST